MIYSLVESAKANGLERYAWLRRVPSASTVDHYEAFLPWNMHPTDLATETGGA